MFFEEWLNSRDNFAQLLVLLARGEDASRLGAVTDAVAFINKYMEHNPWYKERLDIAISRKMPLEIATLVLFLTFQCRTYIDDSAQPGQNPLDFFYALTVFAEEINPIYEIWVLGETPRSKKISHTGAVEWLSSKGKSALVEIGLGNVASSLDSSSNKFSSDRSTVSKWHTTGLESFYERVRKEAGIGYRGVTRIDTQIVDTNQLVFQRALHELFPTFLPNYLDLCNVRESGTKEFNSILNWVHLETKPTHHYQIIGARGSGKTNLLLTAWQKLAIYNSAIVIGLTPAVAEQCKSLDELIKYWMGNKKYKPNEIILLCDDFDKLPPAEQTRWSLELVHLHDWVITATESRQIQTSYILQVSEVLSDYIHHYARKAKEIETGKFLPGLLTSPVFKSYLNRLELVLIFIDLFQQLNDFPTLAQVANQSIETRLGKTGEPEISRIAARKLLTRIFNEISDDRSPNYSTTVDKIGGSEMNLLDILLRAGLVSIKENRLSIEYRLIFDYLVSQEPHNNYFVFQRQTRTQKLYWQVISHYQRRELDLLNGCLDHNCYQYAGFKAKQWDQLATILAILPKQYRNLKSVNFITHIYLSIRDCFPQAVQWAEKDHFLTALPGQLEKDDSDFVKIYTDSLEQLKEFFPEDLAGVRFYASMLVEIAVGNQKTTAKNLLVRSHAFSALHDFSPDEQVFYSDLFQREKWTTLRDRIKRFLGSSHDLDLQFCAAELLLLWGESKLVLEWYEQTRSALGYLRWPDRLNIIYEAAQGDQDALTWV